MESKKPTSSGRGGYREGAGRPEGSHSKLAREAREKAQQTGMLPHEILLEMARGKPQPVFEIDPDTGVVTERWVNLDIDQRRDAAKAAAPYYAPKISTVEVISGVPDNELDSIIAKLAAEAGINPGLSGESPQEENPGPTRRRVLLKS